MKDFFLGNINKICMFTYMQHIELICKTFIR